MSNRKTVEVDLESEQLAPVVDWLMHKDVERAEKEVEVNLDPITEQLMTPDHRKQIDDAVKRNQGHWQSGYNEGYKEGYKAGITEGYKDGFREGRKINEE